ncbi:MAG: hypothetical protein LBC85_00635 [Fibromonadaceae bacterium]|jgi:tetratricopeptide (TPR) repeat protein|nr:hypothetical protein [Fibromonadaceae bacterium]
MYSVILESLNAESDIRAVVGAISNILGVDKKEAVEKARNLPLTLGENLPENEAKLMADMFGSLGAGIKVSPPLDEIPARPIKDFKIKARKKGIPLGCLIWLMLSLMVFSYFASLKYEWILGQFKPSPGQADKLLQRGNIDKARKSIQRQLRAQPNDQELLILQGRFYIGAARKRMNTERWQSFGEAGALPELDSAIMSLRRAESLNPNDGSIPRWISITEQMRRALPEAETAARRAIAIDPSDTDNWNQLGSVLVDLRDISQAEQVFYNALRMSPQNAPTLKNLTILNLYYTKDAERAAGFLFSYLNQRESNNDLDVFQMRMDLATAMIGDFNPPWERLSPPRLPFEEYEKRRAQISADPNLRSDPLLQERLGLLYMSKGDNTTAEGHFIRAVQLDSKNETSRKMLAIMYLKSASYDKALGVMQAAADNNTRDPFFWKNIGVLQKYYRVNFSEASKAFNRYFALGGDSFEGRVRRAASS